MTIAIPASRRDASAVPVDHEPPDPLAVLSSVGEAVYDWDLLTDSLRWSPNAAALLGLDDVFALETGSDFHALTAASSLFSRRDAILNGGRTDPGGGVPYHVCYAVKADAAGRRIVWVDDTGRWFAGADGRAAQARGLVRIAASRGEIEAAIPDIDPPTRCFSRAGLMRVLDAALGGSRSGTGFCLLLVGIEDFEALDRRFGHEAVDEMLAGVAASLRRQTRATDCLARYADDKFALLLNHCDQTQIAPAAARALELLSAAHVETSAGVIRVRGRIGGVVAPRDGRSVHALLRNAETALDRAPGSMTFNLFDSAAIALEDRTRAEDLAAEIVAALNEGRVRLASQPVVAARSGECAMSEAQPWIVRPDGGMLEAATILSAAAKAGLMPLLDHRMLELAVAWLRGHPGVLSLTVSGETLGDPDWPLRVAAFVRLNPGVAERLVFAVSEEVAVAQLARSAAAFGSLAVLGVRTAIAGFGTGNASVRVLRRLKPHLLKIDGALVQNVARSPDDRFLVRCLLGIARQIGAPVIAEWVENAGMASLLAEWGAAYLQGDHFEAAETPSDDGGESIARRAG